MGTNTIELTGPQAAFFEFENGKLYLKAGVTLDHEALAALNVTVNVKDSTVANAVPVKTDLTIAINDVNEAPISLDATNVKSLNENTSVATVVADLAVVDPDTSGPFNAYTYTTNDARFDVVAGQLVLKAGQTVDFEAARSITVQVTATNVDYPAHVISKDVVIEVNDVNEAPTAVTINEPLASIAENASTTARTAVGTISVADDALGTNGILLSGNDADMFEVQGKTLYLKAGAALDFETNPSLDVIVTVGDRSVVGSEPVTTNFSLAVTNVNEAPTSVSVVAKPTGIAENASTVARTEVGTIVIDDDALGTNTISLSGADATLFEVEGNTLYIKAGASLDFETNPSLDVTVTASDSSVVGSTPVLDFVKLAVTNVNEGPKANNDAFGPFAENAAATLDVKANDTDPDVGDTLTVSILSANATGLGASSTNVSSYFSVTGDGKIAFNPTTGLPGAESLFDKLDVGQSSTVTVNYRITDSGGLTSNACAKFTINGALEVIEGSAQVDDVLTGTIYSDLIDGLAGIDTMSGGLGNDTYVVDNSDDVVVETANQGTDTVIASADYTLTANVENLTLTGSAIVGIGNSGANIIIGNDESNSLDGAGGVDTYVGGKGDDTYYVGSASELTRITELADEGDDTIISTVSVTSLAANVENIQLVGAGAVNATGNELDNTITGTNASNLLDGGAGADVLIGGLGNDTYVVDNIGDDVQEAFGQGTDTVRINSEVAGYVLADNVENLTLAFGNALTATGNASANTITGNALDNIISGGAGADTMAGQGGNDTYFVDNAGDKVTETVGNGTDTVNTSVSWTLADNQSVEVINVTGTTNNLNVRGNNLDNTINGGDNVDFLFGAGGNDTLSGGAGDDRLVGSAGADQLLGGDGFDFARYENTTDLVVSLTAPGSNTGDAAGDTYNSIEGIITGSGNDTITGDAASNSLQGGDGNDTIFGLGGNDVITGGNGADRLVGGAGNDTLNGDVGSDTFVFDTAFSATTNVDKVSSYVVADDSIEMSRTVFFGLAPGSTLLTGAFRSGAGVTTAGDADDRIIYDTTTGDLYYDADGAGGAAATKFATLQVVTGTLAADEFKIV